MYVGGISDWSWWLRTFLNFVFCSNSLMSLWLVGQFMSAPRMMLSPSSIAWDIALIRSSRNACLGSLQSFRGKRYRVCWLYVDSELDGLDLHGRYAEKIRTACSPLPFMRV